MLANELISHKIGCAVDRRLLLAFVESQSISELGGQGMGFRS